MPALCSWPNAAISDLILTVSERRTKTLSTNSTTTAHMNTFQVRTSSAMTANSAREKSAALAVNRCAFANLACAIGASEPKFIGYRSFKFMNLGLDHQHEK